MADEAASAAIVAMEGVLPLLSLVQRSSCLWLAGHHRCFWLGLCHSGKGGGFDDGEPGVRYIGGMFPGVRKKGGLLTCDPRLSSCFEVPGNKIAFLYHPPVTTPFISIVSIFIPFFPSFLFPATYTGTQSGRSRVKLSSTNRYLVSK